jgi:hypothetical protein
MQAIIVENLKNKQNVSRLNNWPKFLGLILEKLSQGWH